MRGLSRGSAGWGKNPEGEAVGRGVGGHEHGRFEVPRHDVTGNVGADALHHKRLLNIFPELIGEPVPFARMSGGVVFPDLDGVLSGKNFVGTKCQAQFTVSREVERGRQLNVHQQPVGGDVIRKPARPTVGPEPAAFEGEKNVAALPAPVQAVEIWIQRMIGGESGGVRMIFLWRHTDVETHAVVAARRNSIEPEAGAVLACAEKGRPARRRQPGAIRAAQGDVREQEVQARHGNVLTRRRLVGSGIESERSTGEAWQEFNREIRR